MDKQLALKEVLNIVIMVIANLDHLVSHNLAALHIPMDEISQETD